MLSRFKTNVLVSTANMVAHIINKHDDEQHIAIPPGLTFDQVRMWLASNGYTNEFWTLNGIYQIH
jgi:hypothetical protein